MSDQSLLRVKRSFLAPGRRLVREGAIVRSDDPITNGRAELFEPVTATVEQATAAPGERRNVRRPPKGA